MSDAWPSTPLRIAMTSRGNAVVVSIAGELDIATAESLADALAISALASRPLVLDLASLEFMDSTGLSEILLGWRRHFERGVGYVLLSPTVAVRKILEMTGISEIIAVFDDEAEALCELEGPTC